MNPDLNALLEQLHDVHAPSPVSMWPPAYGWWLLALLCICLVAGLVWWFKYRRRSVKKYFTRELQKVRVDFAVARDKDLLLQNISIFLRRVVRAVDKENIYASSLTASAWLEYLDQIGKTNDFTQGPGRVLADGPFRKHNDYDPEQVLQVVQRWLVKLP
jgi:hypothetical protein